MLASVSPKFKDWLFENRDSTSAACASLVSTIGGFPLESVKSRIQVKRYSGVLDCISKTYQAEGYGGFFRGVTIPLLTVTFVRTASYTIYSNTKKELQERKLWSEDTLPGTALLGLAGGATSGMILSCGTASLEITKVSQQLAVLLSAHKGVPYVPRSTPQAFLDIYRSGGLKGLYTGFPLHFTRDVLGTSLYFSIYDSSRFIVDKVELPTPQFLTTFVCGSSAGILSWIIIYPVDLVKSKVQRNALAGVPRESPWHIFRRLSSGGLSKLYRGLGVSAVRSIFSHGIHWSVLEAVRGEIERRDGRLVTESRD